MVRTTLSNLLSSIISELGYTYTDPLIVSEPPAHMPGDFSTNIALQLATQAKENPRALAERIQEKLQTSEGIAAVEIAGPGFLNITLSDLWYHKAAASDLQHITPSQPSQKIIVEYISANPSGPLHIGNARGGPVGETICRSLEALGHTVAREFYVNDIGGQANKFAATVLHYYKEHFGKPTTFPEKGYPAPYVKDLAMEVVQEEGEKYLAIPEDEQVEAIRKTVIARQVAKIKASTDRMGIHFDRWFYQSEVEDSGYSAETLQELKDNGATLEKDGALWLKSGFQDDDRETVLVKTDGNFGYFLDDIAYHKDKLVARAFDIAIVPLGANHSGHIPRMQAAMQAIKLDPKRYQGVLYQYVQLKEDGETRRMAKREGTFVTSDDVLDEVPLEVFNFFMISKANETHLDFDLQLAKDTSEKNPVYYIQYAHARICSVLKRAEEQDAHDTDLPTEYIFSSEERQLLRHLSMFGDVVEEVAATYRTHILPTYLHELATRYHHFYAHQRIITDSLNETAIRLRISRVSAAILKKGLELLNIVPLEQM